MAERPRIGVTGSHRRWAPSWWCISLAVRLAGGDPERISTHHPYVGQALDGLIISGGNDISPEHYDGDITAKVKFDPDRDQMEIDWIQYAIEHKLPLLGICRGAQLINIFLGGNLHQDIRHLRNLTYNRPGLLPTKQVELHADSNIVRIVGKRHLRVNSLHHQAIDVVGAELWKTGWDLDQLTQAVESSENRLIIGVQWHPEYLIYLPAQLALFQWLVNNARSA